MNGVANTFSGLKAMFKESYANGKKCKGCGKVFSPKIPKLGKLPKGYENLAKPKI